MGTLPAARLPGFRLALDIERHCSADKILQGCLIDLSPSWMSMARLTFPSRLELNRPEGSRNAAPLANVILTTFLYVSPVQHDAAVGKDGSPRRCRPDPLPPFDELGSGPWTETVLHAFDGVMAMAIPPLHPLFSMPQAISTAQRISGERAGASFSN